MPTPLVPPLVVVTVTSVQRVLEDPSLSDLPKRPHTSFWGSGFEKITLKLDNFVFVCVNAD